MESQPADRDNFTLLLKELHQALGKGKLLTIAVGANVKSPQEWVDVKSITPYLDYINLMTYDMAYGTQYFNANLYDSKRWPTVAAADRYSADFVVKNYLAAGLKPAQMNLGIGFYGRVPETGDRGGYRLGQAGRRQTSGDGTLLQRARNRPVQRAGAGSQQRHLL